VSKKRVLLVNEGCYLNTGFSNIGLALLERLAATGKFELGEHASYCNQFDPRVQEFVKGRWKFYGNAPLNAEEAKAHDAAEPAQPGQNTNQFGKYKFEKVLLDFKPDIVIDIRDWWMTAFELRSPLRKFFKLLWMSTVDSVPQREEWVQDFEKVDYMLAYSDFGINTLRKTSPKLEVRFDHPQNKKLIGLEGKSGKLHPVPLRPGVELKTFYPRDKAETKAKWNIKPDIPIVCLVQRNQIRKRIPEAIQAFALMKNKYAGNQHIDKAVLLLHTSWPDNIHSFDYPREIARASRGWHGMMHHRKTLFSEVLNTYQCHNPSCRFSFIAHAALLVNAGGTNWAIKCQKCGQISARTPNTDKGYTREQLSDVYNMSDILLQMSIAEGCGLTVQEAKACGTMALATESAALAEKVSIPDYDHIIKETYDVHLGGDKLNVAYKYYEPETGCWRVHTDIEHAADQMAKYLMDRELLKKMQDDARACAVKHYDWDKNWKEWEYILDNISIKDRAQTWDSPVNIINWQDAKPPTGVSDQDFIVWCYNKVLRQDVDVKGLQDWLRTIQYYQERGATNEVARKQVLEFFQKTAEGLNQSEYMRAEASAPAKPTGGLRAIVV
jgi:glycosyltransferase involved in cell wall biosynthesis